jgi:hypothetical protein
MVYLKNGTDFKISEGTKTLTINGDESFVNKVLGTDLFKDTELTYSFLIVEHPAQKTVEVGETVSFDVRVSSPQNNFKYKWYKNGVLLETSPAWTSAGKSNSLIVPVSSISQNEDEYHVEVNHPQLGILFSNKAKLMVSEKEAGIIILKQPQSQVVYAGQSATFSVLAESPNPLNYVWQIGESYTSLPGENASDLVIDPSILSQDGNQYSVLVTDDQGNQVQSLSAYFRVMDPNVNTSDIITLKGQLLDNDGNALFASASEPKDMVVRLYDQSIGGEALYTEWFVTQFNQPVIVTNGNFTIKLGTGFSKENLKNTIQSNTNLYAEFGVGGFDFQEIIPERLPLTSVPYASSEKSIIHGEGVPTNRDTPAAIGVWYVDDLTNKTYQKIDGAWIEIR